MMVSITFKHHDVASRSIELTEEVPREESQRNETFSRIVVEVHSVANLFIGNLRKYCWWFYVNCQQSFLPSQR